MKSPLAPKSVFDQALDLINAGDLGAAETRCRAALKRYPRDVNIQALLGALLVKMERGDEAEATLRAVIAAAPTFAKPHEDLGHLLVQANRPADALPILERATRLDPSLERAWFTLGKTLALLRRGPEADAAFEKCFALSPERRLMALAAEHQKEGRLEEAERIYRQVLRQNLRNVDAMRLLALIAIKTGRADDEPQVRRLLEFCGLPWEDACLRFYESDRPVRTPSSEQVRQPIYDRSIGHWRNYEGELGELIAVIEPIRDRYRRYEPGNRTSRAAGGEARPGIAPGGM